MKRFLNIFLLIILMIFTLCSCTKTDNNIDNYAENIKAYEAGAFMPDLDNIGEYEDIEYFTRKGDGIFPECSMQLVVKYNEETFLAEKQRLESAYTYLEEPQKAAFDDTVYTIPIEEFEVFGFDFRIAKFEDTVYPKNFGMVGLSDEKFEIVYLWIYAPDLDYICETNRNEIKEMAEFIEYHFSLE